MACLCWDSFQSAVSARWQSAQTSLPTKVRAGVAGEMRSISGRGNPPSTRNRAAKPAIAIAPTAKNAAIRSFDFHKRAGRVLAGSIRASASILAGLDLVTRFDGLSLLLVLSSLRATNCYSLDG